MTSKERVARAMGFDLPDRVPVMSQMSIGHMLLQLALSPVEFWHSAEVFAEGLLRMRALYKFDGILISLYGHSPDWEKKIIRLDKDAEGEWVHWANGDSTFFPFDDLPVHRSAESAKSPDLSTFDPEFLTEQRMRYIPVSQGLRFPIDVENPFEVFDIVHRTAGNDYSIHGEVASPLDYFLDIFGFEQSFLALVEQPLKCKALFEKLTERIIPLALGEIEHGADAIKISSPYAGAGFLSPRFYRDFILPFEGRIASAVRQKGVHVYIHTCGDVHDRLELMAGSGVTGIECLDPPPLGKVDLEEAKRMIGRDIFIKGNVDPVHVLLQGSHERIKEDICRRITIGKPGSGFILSTACSIAPRTPRSHVLLLEQTVEEFGSYASGSIDG